MGCLEEGIIEEVGNKKSSMEVQEWVPKKVILTWQECKSVVSIFFDY